MIIINQGKLRDHTYGMTDITSANEVPNVLNNALQ